MLRILTAINSGKSRQTNAIILCRIISEFNADFTNFAPLKLIWFESLSANRERAASLATAAGLAVARAVDFLCAGGGINRSAVIFPGNFAAVRAFDLVVEFFNVFFKDFTALAAFIFKKRHDFAPFSFVSLFKKAAARATAKSIPPSVFFVK